jgi:hypothetical protein
MFDNDTQLLVNIFQKVFQLRGKHTEGEELDPMKYVERYKRQIEIAGQLFGYLGLAEPHPESPLGWKPTHLLLEVIAKRAVRRSKLIDRIACEEDTLIVSLLCDAVFADASYVDRSVCTTGLGFSVLRALGLLRETTDGDNLPTPGLQELFAGAYYARRQASRERKGKLALQALTNDAGRQSAR